MEREQAIKLVQQLLTLMKQKGGSDLFITAGFPPAIKLDGQMTPVMDKPLMRGCLGDDRAQSDERPADQGVRSQTNECNFAIAPPRHRPLPRQCLRAAGPRGRRAAHHQDRDSRPSSKLGLPER